MISFILSLVCLVLGYLLYGRFVERVFRPDGRPTPAISMADGVDYIAFPTWKVFMIQFLNIAGTGPIFGAIMGAWYGPAAYLWIVLGCIFAGAVHDYLSGMLSVRHQGKDLPELVGIYLGHWPKRVLLVFSILLLIMVGVVFVYSPALILQHLGGGLMFWILVIFVYYVLATMLPIDKIIGRLYPFFAVALLFMAVSLMVMLFVKMPALPELWGTYTPHDAPAELGIAAYIKSNPLLPCLFITIACGAISGFHATQSPLMARCLKSEKMGRPVFYGAMITEGVVALIWATVSMYFFYYGGWREVVDPATLSAFNSQFADPAQSKTLVQFFQAPDVVLHVCRGWLGVFGGVLAIIGVVAAPITSGDTAFRSARLIIAEALGVKQKSVGSRLIIAVPMFAVAIALLVWQINNPDGFNVIWRWFGWSNQTLSVFTLWTITVFLTRRRPRYWWVTFVPAVFMTTICTIYPLIASSGFGLPLHVGYAAGLAVAVVSIVWYAAWRKRYGRLPMPGEENI